MFDFVKRVLGLSDCRGCKYRRLGGLYCGKHGPFAHFRPTPWSKYGCWHYVSTRIVRGQAVDLRTLRRRVCG